VHRFESRVAGAHLKTCARRVQYFSRLPDYAPLTNCFFPRIAFFAIVALKPAIRKGSAMTLTLRRIGIAAAAALLVSALGMKPLYAMGTDSPSQPTSDCKKKKTKNCGNAIDVQQQQQAWEKFKRDYHDARLIILAGNYRGGIAAMHALGHDDNADVANYIGYAYRKLGNYDQSKIWYEAALKADPNHVRTWSYYGMWQMEQGNRLKALDDLQKVKLICGNESCEAFRQLKDVIDGKATY
jgi:tetratricopeptide (TPR) repeat protein